MTNSEWEGTAWAGDQVDRAIVRADTAAFVRGRAIDSFTEYPGLTEQLLAVQGLAPAPWRPIGVREALTNPAVWRAVTLLATTAGSLSIAAYRNGDRMTDPPRIVTRPNPFLTLRDFIVESVWNLACYGDLIWYVGAEDVDRNPLSLIVLNPAEVIVEWDDRRWSRVYKWRDVVIPNRRIRHLTYVREPGALRGVGPLQLCGAALSVAIEAAEWAARFYAEGGVPSVVLESPMILTDTEAATVRQQWLAKASNTVRVASGVKPQPFQISPEQAQMSQSRLDSVGDVCRMFGIPGALMEFAAAGSSLTYQNIGQVGTMLARFTLAPGYLEPIEQTLSDLLPRSIVTRFEIDGLMRADRKERFETLKIGIDGGFVEADQAAVEEGYKPGGTEFAPMPPNLAGVDVPVEVLRHG